MNFRIRFALTLLLIFTVSISFSANASTTSNYGGHSKQMIKVLKDKFNLTDKDIASARAQGKTAFDLAKEKGVSETELRLCIIKEAEKSINNLINKGLMPKFLGDRIKEKARAKIQIWDGRL